MNFLLSFLLLTDTTYTAELQVRPRTEWRDGYKVVQTAADASTLATQQRTRIGLTASFPRWEVKVGLQDVRTYGADGQVGTYEAWGAWKVSDQTRITLGRQAIQFDDERVVGALDWAQTGRFLDGIRLTHRSGLGLTSAVYTRDPATLLHRSMLHHVYEGSGHRVAGLLFDERSPVESRFTAGLNYKYRSESGWFAGLELDGQFTDSTFASLFAAEVGHQGTGRTTLGLDRLSGGDETAFNPMLGTNHKWYGWMDHFYVGTMADGLFNARLAHVRPLGKGASIGIIAHHFRTPDAGRLLGNEVDTHVTFKPTKEINATIGYSAMVAGEAHAERQGRPFEAGVLQQWGWISVSFFPQWLL